MNPKEFISFLNGAVELGGVKELDVNTYRQLQSHLLNVENTQSKEGIFCTWLKGFLEAKDSESVNKKEFVKILDKMTEAMKDNNYPSVKSNSGSDDFGRSELIRC